MPAAADEVLAVSAEGSWICSRGSSSCIAAFTAKGLAPLLRGSGEEVGVTTVLGDGLLLAAAGPGPLLRPRPEGAGAAGASSSVGPVKSTSFANQVTFLARGARSSAGP